MPWIADLTPPLTRQEWIIAAGALLIGFCVAAAAGLFDGRATFSPERLPENAPSSNLWLGFFVGLFGQLILPGLLVAPMLAPLAKPPSAHQTAMLFLASSFLGFATLFNAHQLLRPRWRISRSISNAIVPALVGAAAIIPLVIGLNLLVQEVGSILHLRSPAGHELLNAFNDESSSKLDRWCVVLSAVVGAPLFEEMLFRGYLQTALRRLTGGPWPAIILTGGLFALAHFSAWMFAPLFLLAVGLGYVYERTANLYATIFIHASFNLLMIGLDVLLLSHH